MSALILFGLGVASAVILGIWLYLGDSGVDYDDDEEWDTIDYPKRKP